jgi:uncharacterized protein (DUF302 family)
VGEAARRKIIWVTPRLSDSKNGIVQIKSTFSFADTFERLKSNVASRGLKVFATINFSEDAQNAGLKMNPARLLIFGNPKAGTPLMVAAPSLALDFPLKILVSQDQNGQVWVTYNSPQYLKQRHNVPDELLKNIVGIVSIAESSAK